LVLGQPNVDHTWVANMQYYVIKQLEGRCQVLPLFVIKFKQSNSTLCRILSDLSHRDKDEGGSGLELSMKGGYKPEKARKDAGMTLDSTRHLWIGWLNPKLRFTNNDDISEDVCEFLEGYAVKDVIPERNGVRIGAYVLLEESIGRAEFDELSLRKYKDTYYVSVDDAQPNNPRCSDKVCPRLHGPSRYCRGWNVRGHLGWQWACSFSHPQSSRITHGATYSAEVISEGTAKYDEIETEMGRSMAAQIQTLYRISNAALEEIYNKRKQFIHDKVGFTVEKELWHGTNCQALPELLTHGLQPPSDTKASDDCPYSGGKGLSTTLCGTDCQHCCEPHLWNKCHMYGLGVYLADVAMKSHRYVREPENTEKGKLYSMLRCRVVLGNPYLIEGDLLTPEGMHDMCWCLDPSEALESVAEEWDVAKGHDCYYVRGRAGKQKAGLGVYNSEYIVFQPYQILPLYRVDYYARD